MCRARGMGHHGASLEASLVEDDEGLEEAGEGAERRAEQDELDLVFLKHRVQNALKLGGREVEERLLNGLVQPEGVARVLKRGLHELGES